MPDRPRRERERVQQILDKCWSGPYPRMKIFAFERAGYRWSVEKVARFHGLDAWYEVTVEDDDPLGRDRFSGYFVVGDAKPPRPRPYLRWDAPTPPRVRDVYRLADLVVTSMVMDT